MTLINSNMKIIIAKTAGFCMGVRRAVELTLKASSNKNHPVYTYGPLIHNPQVLKLLSEKSVSVLEKIPKKGAGTVLIRAHGVSPADKKKLKNVEFDIIDATCPHVVRVQTIIQKHKEKGYASIIVGDKKHPEVIGLLGCAGEKGYVIDKLSALDMLPDFEKAVIVAQTTQNTTLFDRVFRWAKDKFPNYKAFNTICDSTKKRQDEIKQLAKMVDAIVIVGAHHSGNTCRLAEIASQYEKPTFHVETESELDLNFLESVNSIGVSGGASTPDWIIKNICRTIEKHKDFT